MQTVDATPLMRIKVLGQSKGATDYQATCVHGRDHVVGCEVTWGEVMWLVATCHVMSCDVM